MKKIISVLFCAAVAISVWAQDIIMVQAPEVVGCGEQFNIVFTIEGEKPTDFNWQPDSEFNVLWGPQAGTSSSVTIINGKTTRSSTTSYTYVVEIQDEGTFSIPQASAKVKGKSISSSPRSIRVVKSGSSSPSQGSSERAGSTGTVDSGDLFLRMSVSKRNVIVGEPVIAEIKLYQRVNIAGFEDVHFPTFDGFWSQEVETPSNIEFHRETVGSEIYNAAVLRSYRLIPQQKGELTIDPAELVCLVNVRSQGSGSGSLFDSFFESDYRTIRKRIASHPLTLNVSPLPAGAPASFCGGVGKYSMEAYLTRDSLSAHEAASLIVKVTGSGNTMLLEAPKISFPPDFETYDVKTTENGATKTFEYPFIPRSPGKFSFRPVEFSWFDIDSRTYRTSSSPSMEITVSPGANAGNYSGPSSQTFTGVAGRDVRDIGSDIRFISTKVPAFREPGRFFVWSVPFCVAAAFMLLLAIVVLLVVGRVRATRSDVAATRTKAASKMAAKRLSSAEDYLKRNLYSAFYEELHRALVGFAADKLNISQSEQNKDNIADGFRRAGVPEDTVASYISILDACEFARYSPSGSNDAMAAHYSEAAGLISSIDAVMKRSRTSRKALVPIVTALILSIPASSFAADDLPGIWSAGCDAYSAGNPESALTEWRKIEAGGSVSPSLYYNMGCAFFKTGDLSHSVLYFERALKLDPSYEDARANLDYVSTFLQDRIEAVPEFFLASWVRSLRNSLPSDSWAVLALVFFAAFLAGAVIFLLSGRRGRTGRLGFFSSVAAVLLSALFVSFSSRERREASDECYAVIVSGVSAVRSAPDSNTGTDLFVLHEGTKVEIIDSIGEWDNISLPDGRQGWIIRKEIEII
ncbi:MAG: BatD family protein [Bacteroidales bacterium]|nr:BatD family protein [Bacteroidales bacterium]